jgi:hypothetical protein
MTCSFHCSMVDAVSPIPEGETLATYASYVTSHNVSPKMTKMTGRFFASFMHSYESNQSEQAH